MFRIKQNIFIIAFFIIYLLPQILFAENETIASSSFPINNVDARREKLAATVPVWSDQKIKTLFSVYKNPDFYHLSPSSNPHVYNIQFIHVFFGPIHNPFNQTPRPAKVFLIYDNTFYMAPIVKNEADTNYYVFDNSTMHPRLLKDWIAYVDQFNAGKTARFNVCAGYGNYPTDTCTSNYWKESLAAYAQSITKKSAIFPSAKRNPREDWQHKIRKLSKKVGYDDILSNSVDWNNVKARDAMLANVNSWKNLKTIEDNFHTLRDLRFFDDPNSLGFLRRISWLYPDDGCWTRTSAILSLFGPLHFIENKIAQRPSKIFVFGNLCVNTANSPNGYVSWWYHTVPIVRAADTQILYVIDPAINPRHAMRLTDWIEAMRDKTGKCGAFPGSVRKFAICTGYGATPEDKCQTSHQEELNAIYNQQEYLMLERERQEWLGRKADAVLGDLPPWLGNDVISTRNHA